MTIYLPIAEMSVDVFLILAMGGTIGFLSGVFGVGGGFLMTPLLIFIGVPPAVAVTTGANQILASSVSGVLAHLRRGNVDLKIGAVLTVGGFAGSGVGVGLFTVLRHLGQIDLIISLCYVVFLGIIGTVMLVESGSILLRGSGSVQRRKLHRHNWLQTLPYLLEMPTSVVIGTSLLQIIFVTASVTFLQAINTQTVDVVLALLLLAGAVVGAQFGSRASDMLRGEQLRGLLALMVLAVCGKVAYDLFVAPTDLYSITHAMALVQ